MTTRRALIIVLAVSLATTAFLAYRWRQAQRRELETLHWVHAVMDSLGTTVHPPGPPVGPEGRDSVYWQWVATTAQLQSRRWQEAVRQWIALRSTLLDETDIAELKQEGLGNPPEQLRESLDSRTDLIPFRGIQGGRMFFEPGSVVLLQPHFAFAKFDDGHIGGALLLEYEVTGPGQIKWKRLWAALD